MCLEQRRKELQANSPQWGDHPTTLSSAKSRNQYMAREEPISLSGSAAYYDQRASSLDALISSFHMNQQHTMEMPSKLAISTKGWQLTDIFKRSENFHPVPRVSALLSQKSLSEKIESYERGGVPLVVEGWHSHSQWPAKMFTVDNFTQSSVDGNITARNVYNWTDKVIPLDTFITNCRETPRFANAEETERLYGKDAQCPKEWNEWLHKGVIPKPLLPGGPTDVFRYRPNAVETLMCYLGIGDTFTPCHKDLCASSGQNLMCYTENSGSSFWFMTESSAALDVSRYFQSLGQEVDHETHVITIDELAKAPFKVYITEQKLGDLVLVPPRSCHQVVNYGGITIKTSWSRMTLDGLATAYYHELPVYRRVCRPEIYQVKNTIYHTLVKITEELGNPDRRAKAQTRRKSLPVARQAKFAILTKLLELFDSILLDEYAPNHRRYSTLPSSSGVHEETENRVSCDFCGADIFQSFFECRKCVYGDSSEGGYAVCPGCYIEGRSCLCVTMKPMQLHQFGKFLEDRDKTLAVLAVANEGEKKSNKFRPTKALFGRQTRGAFNAACILLDLRTTSTGTKCYTEKEKPHQNENDALYCKKCHHGKCFAHILSGQRLHSVDALLLLAADKSHEIYHKNHIGNKRHFEDALPQFLSCQKLGQPPDLKIQLVHTAMSYGRCKPVNPAFMRQGWYDTIAYITSASAGEDRTGGPARGDESPLTSCSTTPCMSPTIPDMVIPNSLGPLVGMRATPPPQHRTFMECVQIPSPRPFISLRADRNEVVPIAVSAEPPPTTLPGQPPGPLNCKRKRRVENQKEANKTRPSRQVNSQEATDQTSTNIDNVYGQRLNEQQERLIPPPARGDINTEASSSRTDAALKRSFPNANSDTSLMGALNKAARQNSGQTSDIEGDLHDHDGRARISKKARTGNSDRRTSTPRRSPDTGALPTRFRKSNPRRPYTGVGRSQTNAVNTDATHLLPDPGLEKSQDLVETTDSSEEISRLREQVAQLLTERGKQAASFRGLPGPDSNSSVANLLSENSSLSMRVARLEQRMSEKPVETPLPDTVVGVLTSLMSEFASRQSANDYAAKGYCQSPAVKQDHQYRYSEKGELYYGTYDVPAPYLNVRHDASSLEYPPQYPPQFRPEHGPQFDRPAVYERPAFYDDYPTNHGPRGESNGAMYEKQPWGRKALNTPSRGRVNNRNNAKNHFTRGSRHNPVVEDNAGFHYGHEGSTRGPRDRKGPPLGPRALSQGMRPSKAPFNPASHFESSKHTSPPEVHNHRRPQSQVHHSPARVERDRLIAPLTHEAVDNNNPESSTAQLHDRTHDRATPTRQQDITDDNRCLVPLELDPQAWEDNYDLDSNEPDNNAGFRFREPSYQPLPSQNMTFTPGSLAADLSFNPSWT